MTDTAERARAYIERRSIPEPNSGCWIWEGTFDETGNGNAIWERRGVYAHRIAYFGWYSDRDQTQDVFRKCGNTACVNPDHLVGGRKFTDLTGKKFGRLLVQAEVRKPPSKRIYWACLCDCGNTHTVRPDQLVSGEIVSCGCYMREAVARRETVHGHARRGSHSAEFEAWGALRERCNKPSSPEYKNYGGRGITVCQRWDESFQSFFDDVGRRPSPKHSLDRIDVNGNYEPGNVRWALYETQVNNKRNTVYFEPYGVRVPVSILARAVGMNRNTLKARLEHGFDLVSAIRGENYTNV